MEKQQDYKNTLQKIQLRLFTIYEPISIMYQYLNSAKPFIDILLCNYVHSDSYLKLAQSPFKYSNFLIIINEMLELKELLCILSLHNKNHKINSPSIIN